jgi:hypothetical protein
MKERTIKTLSSISLLILVLTGCSSGSSTTSTEVDISTPQGKSAAYNENFAASTIDWLCGESLGLACPDVPAVGPADPSNFDKNLSITVEADANFEYINVHIPLAWGEDEDIYCVYQEDEGWNDYAFNELIKEFFWDLKFNLENRDYPPTLLPSKGFIFTSEYLLYSKYKQDRLGIEIPRTVLKKWSGDRIGVSTEDAKVIVTDGDVFIDYRKAHTLGELLWHPKSIDYCWFTEDGKTVGNWLRY